ncbi:hypothetical protein MMC18_003825 [Xylographa bjoerkii]|nr:hypothetical protein [Xylographa bjoerkii]
MPFLPGNTILLAVFTASICLNVLLLIKFLPYKTLASPEPVSRYPNLEYSQEHLLPFDTENSLGTNDTQMDYLWESLVEFLELVALNDAFIREKKLPHFYPFPWDDSKGVYIAASYHYLHYLKMLYISITEAHRGHDQSLRYLHLVHCLDRFRQEIVCHAHDTLLYIHKKDSNKNVKVINIQSHQCRDWNELETWARERTACYTDHHFEHPHKWDNYKNCPPDSTYLPKVREQFNLPSDWLPNFNS